MEISQLKVKRESSGMRRERRSLRRIREHGLACESRDAAKGGEAATLERHDATGKFDVACTLERGARRHKPRRG